VCLCEFIEIADEKSVEYRAVGDRSLLLQRGSVVVQLQTYIQRERERERTPDCSLVHALYIRF